MAFEPHRGQAGGKAGSPLCELPTNSLWVEKPRPMPPRLELWAFTPWRCIWLVRGTAPDQILVLRLEKLLNLFT